PHISPLTSLSAASTFLGRYGFRLKQPANVVQRHNPREKLSCLSPPQQSLAHSIRDIAPPATTNLSQFYDRASQVLAQIISARKLFIWAVNPTHPILTLVGEYPPGLVGRHRTLPRATALSAIALERHQHLVLNLTENEPAAIYNKPEAKPSLPDVLD